MSDSIFTFIKSNPIIFAGIFGIIPAILWLWFWLKEDIHPEPNKLIVFTFLCGMLSTFLAIPLQHSFELVTGNTTALFFLWAMSEESLKLGSAWVGGLHTSQDDEPIDPIIYMIVAALGFVAMENTLFLVDPLISGNLIGTFLTNNLRFIGATLLHITASSTVGVAMAVSFKKTKVNKIIYVLLGLILATVLHTLFNLFIMNSSDSNIFLVFGFIWVGLIVLMLTFEKIKMSDSLKA
jgi:RsiW-degrading membrane proteinase PrsW (M82 family)